MTTTTVKNLSDLRADGTTLGQSTSDLISFYGKTPIVQPSSANQAAVATTAVTTASTTTSPAGYATTTQANNIAAQVAALVVFCNQLRTDLVALGIIKGAA